jgi:hypothetical protein
MLNSFVTESVWAREDNTSKLHRLEDISILFFAESNGRIKIAHERHYGYQTWPLHADACSACKSWAVSKCCVQSSKVEGYEPFLDTPHAPFATPRSKRTAVLEDFCKVKGGPRAERNEGTTRPDL